MNTTNEQNATGVAVGAPDYQKNLLALLKNCAVEARPCRACGATLYMVVHANGKKAPYTEAGVNHFIDCPQAGRFRRNGGGHA